MGPVYTPPITKGQDGKIGLLYIPNGANWPGGSLDPETGILYVFSNTLTRLISLGNDPKRSDMDYVNSQGGGDTGGGLTVQGLSLVKPPYGRITAIDLNKGDIVWQVPHGNTLDSVKENPALKGVTIPKTGRIGPTGTPRRNSWRYSLPSRLTVATSSRERALTTDAPTPCRPPEWT